MPKQRICSVPDCGNPYKAKGFCARHYYNFRNHGDPNGGGAKKGEPAAFLASVIDLEGDACVFWPYATTPRGYAVIRTKDRGNQVVSTLVCEKSYGPRPSPKHQAAHSCGNGHLGCIRKNHLRWATPLENAADNILHRREGKKEFAYVKLTEDDVRDIRVRLAAGEKHQAIADAHCIDRTSIGKIKARKYWDWLE